MTKTITRIGNCRGLMLDTALMDLAHLKVGDRVSVTVHEGGSIVLTPLRPVITSEQAAAARVLREEALLESAVAPEIGLPSVTPTRSNGAMKLLSTFVIGAILLAVGNTTPAQAAGKVGTGRSFKGPVGLQLYSLRDEFKKDVRRTLDLVQSYGFLYVELAGTYGWLPRDFRAALLERGLVPIAGHFSYERWRDEPEFVLRDAKALGLKYAGCAWIPHEGDFDEAECRAAIEVFNRAGELAARERIQFFYHNHGYEFQPYGDGTLLDLLITGTNPKWVAFEMDLLWTVHPGQDPVRWLQKYPKRWPLMHLKDLKRGVEGDLSGHTDVTNDVILGTGQMDMPAILKAARKARVKYYFIEDESPSAKEQIPQSLRFLERVSW